MERKHWIPLLFVFLVVRTLVHADPDGVRLDSLESAYSRSPNGIIPLTESTFKNYIESTPRSYSIFVLFTASARVCQVCPEMTRVVGKVAKEYSSLPARRQGRYPVFFGELQLAEGNTIRQLLASYGVNSVPALYHLSAGDSKYPGALKSSDKYTVENLQPNPIRRFINRKAKSSLRIVNSGPVPLLPLLAKATPILFFLIGVLLFSMWKWAVHFSRYFWLGATGIVYIFSMVGGHYIWIHNTPWAFVNQDGTWNWVEQGSSRSQHAAEGFLFALLCVSIAGLIIMIQELPRIVETKNEQRALGWPLVVLLFLLVNRLNWLYQLKSPRYLVHSGL